MNEFPSSAGERAIAFPGVVGGLEPVRQTRNQHRWAFTVLIGLLTLLAVTFEWGLFAAEGWTLLNLLLFGLLTLLFTHVAIGFAQAFFGFLILSDRCPYPETEPSNDDLPSLPVTAIVLPVFNEDVGAVFARLRVMYHALKAQGTLDHFHFFILSDSIDQEKAFEEKLAWERLVTEADGTDRIFYRHRKLPINRKSGNIADFCRRWGSLYRYMICLDADSLMSAPTLVALVRRMEDNHRIGILQTVPRAINGRTIWSRLQQFSMSLYGPLFATGANFWQQEESNFWGHNAIIRLAPFIKHCALPELPGQSAIGRRPMSHDFVEAALMRRAGWEVRLADDLRGSYEETPPNVVEHLKRDRRWCQGNLQHWPLVLARGFRPVTRFHFLHGIFSFLASPLLALVLLLGFLKNLGAAPLSEGLYADAARAQIAILLFGFTMLLLILPKLFALALAFRHGRAPEFGGAWKMVASAFLEMAVSILLAPVFLYFHGKFVLFSLLGKNVEWHAQRRTGSDARDWREAGKVFRLPTLLGLATGLLTWWLTPGYFFWLLPIILGWLLAIPLTASVADWRGGLLLQKAGLFLVPDEVSSPAEVRALRRAADVRVRNPKKEPTAGVIDPLVHRQLNRLTTNEHVQLHRQIWTTPATDLTPAWRQQLARLEMRTP